MVGVLGGSSVLPIAATMIDCKCRFPAELVSPPPANPPAMMLMICQFYRVYCRSPRRGASSANEMT
jgi:hypothetical protein